jgi:hypothetical protein
MTVTTLTWYAIQASTLGSGYSIVTTSSFDSSVPVASLAIALDGNVIRMRGRLRTTTGFANNGLLFRVPTFARPVGSRLLTAIASGGAAQGIDVMPNGQVLFRRSGVTGSLDLSFDDLAYHLED